MAGGIKTGQFLALAENSMDLPHVHSIFTKVTRSFIHDGQSFLVPNRIFMILELCFFHSRSIPESSPGSAVC